MPKKEVMDARAAAQPKGEAVDTVDSYVDNRTTPEICLSHLPTTEEVGGQHAPSQAFAANSLAVEADASILYCYSNDVLAQFKQKLDPPRQWIIHPSLHQWKVSPEYPHCPKSRLYHS